MPLITAVPLRGCSVDILSNTKWTDRGLTVAGGNGKGRRSNQLSHPYGLFVDDYQTIYVADCANHRIMEWKYGAAEGKVVAGGNRQGSGAHQLYFPNDVIIDKEKDCLIISDRGNRRVVRWPRRHEAVGETIISDIDCIGVTMDESGALYVADHGRHEVRKYEIGDTKGTVVAGGNGKGAGLDQLSSPGYIFVDRNHSVYVSEWDNNRVTKWDEGAKQGIIVAGAEEQGNNLTQLSRPLGVVVDQMGTVFVADKCNNRIMRWSKDDTQGCVIIGDNACQASSNQLSEPEALSFDQHGNLYVVDKGNFRVKKFNIA
ncbi:unnamed protein product [Rotaria sp. Silwood2]|nr:unnamed protein product [Rotaria sp. Silwood2]